MSLTHGGLLESDALHWNDETRRRLGHIIFLLSSGKRENARRGYIEFYKMKRHFMVDEFCEFIEKLNRHREEGGFKPLSELLHHAADQIVKYGDTLDEPETPAGPIDISKPVQPIVEPVSIPENPHVEQMELFL